LDTDSNTAVQNTLNQIYNNHANLAYLMYNDESTVNPNAESFGHTKGVVAYNANGGFWLVHSVPLFPPAAASGFSMPSNSYVYGQSFLCMTFGASAIDKVGQALLINNPFVYDHNMPSALQSVSQNMVKVLAGDWVKQPTGTSFGVTTAGGTAFTVFAKNKQWKADLYSKLVAPTIKSNIYVETWMNGPATNKLPTDCAGSKYPYSVLNVDQVALTPSISWLESDDHSKWAITTTANPGEFCIGDINRQVSQANRGGGTVCSVNAAIWSSFNSFIAKSDKCKGYNNRRGAMRQ